MMKKYVEVKIKSKNDYHNVINQVYINKTLKKWQEFPLWYSGLRT